MTNKFFSITIGAAMLAATAAGSASAFSASPGAINQEFTGSPVIKVSAATTWNKLFRPHPYTGERFPYDLRGRFTGDPDIRVRDRRKFIGEIYQCTYSRDLQGRMIICD